MLGADLIGFHTQFHCNNFLETVERAIEGRVDWDDFTRRRAASTAPTCGRSRSAWPPDDAEPPPDRASACGPSSGSRTEWLGVGVERVDYTKGLPERFRALRRFFERWPEYRRPRDVRADRLAQPQPASRATGRSRRRSGRPCASSTRSSASAAGSRSSTASATTTTAEIRRFYRAADFCMVTSLHDGMNLVAKEYVAARRATTTACLILSRFTGASRELRDA